MNLRDLDAESLRAHLQWATTAQPDYQQLLVRVLTDAAAKRRERRVQQRIDDSGLDKAYKTLEAFDWHFQPKLDRTSIEELATLRFIDGAEDVVMTGKAGTGKSHLLKAIALRACRDGRRVLYARCVDLIANLYAGLADNTYERRLKRWCRAELLIIDDVGLGQLRRTRDEPTAAHMLFNLIDRRHLTVSTALTSNIKLSAWGQYLGDTTLAAAILDRLAESATFIDIDGPSYRQERARKRAAEKASRKSKSKKKPS